MRDETQCCTSKLISNRPLKRPLEAGHPQPLHESKRRLNELKIRSWWIVFHNTYRWCLTGTDRITHD